MWTTVYVAPSKETAEQIKNILMQEGFLVKMQPLTKSTRDEEFYEVMVPEAEAVDAQDTLISRGIE